MNAKRISLCMAPATVLIAALAILAQAPGGNMPSQQQPQQPQSPSGSTTGPGMYPGTAATAQNEGDKAFVSKALQGGNVEVQLGQLAQQKSQSDDVRQFGQKMVNDHSQMADKWFKPVAQQLGVSVPNGPSKKDKKMIDKLEGLSGQDFDKEYIAAMVKDHRQDLKEFKSEAQSAQDPNVKQLAERGTNIISQHLQLIEQIAKSHNVTVEGKSSQTSSMQ